MNIEIYNRVRILRDTLGLTQSDFGEKVGVSKDVMANIECHRLKTAPHINFFKLICKTFNVRNEWLFDGQGEMFDRQSESSLINKLQDEFNLTTTEIDLLETYLEMEEKDRQVFANFLNNLASKSKSNTSQSGMIVLHTDTNQKEQHDSGDNEMQILAADTGDLNF